MPKYEGNSKRASAVKTLTVVYSEARRTIRDC